MLKAIKLKQIRDSRICFNHRKVTLKPQKNGVIPAVTNFYALDACQKIAGVSLQDHYIFSQIFIPGYSIEINSTSTGIGESPKELFTIPISFTNQFE